MSEFDLMIYGAYGYTGRLIAAEAVQRGHRPLLAGRSPQQLTQMADSLGLNHEIVNLQDVQTLREALGRVRLVVHAAGPFVHTSRPMVLACLDTGTHYLDITGEVPVFESIFKLHQAARERQVALMPGAGYDVVPSDCLSAYVSQKLPQATALEINVLGVNRMSRGTASSIVEMLPAGMLQRVDGQLTSAGFAQQIKKVPFPGGARRVTPVPWGDLVTAFHSTGIPNITNSFALSRTLMNSIRILGPLAQRASALQAVRWLMRQAVKIVVSDPSNAWRHDRFGAIHALVRDPAGNYKQAWLKTPEPYLLTAQTAVRSAEGILSSGLHGALTPSHAFGQDFILQFSGIERMDELP
jgi:short subunit dehydrogenase-like uncharacterized protein